MPTHWTVHADLINSYWQLTVDQFDIQDRDDEPELPEDYAEEDAPLGVELR